MSTKTMKAGGPASRRAAAEIARLAGSPFPDAEQHIQNLLDHAINHTGPEAVGLRQVRENLVFVYETFGSEVLANTTKFLSDHHPDAYSENTVYTVAQCFKEGNAALLERTIEFARNSSGCWNSWDFSSLIKSVALRGTNELERGMDLAPPVAPLTGSPALQKYWNPEKENARRRGEFALLTGKLGFDKLKEIISKLKAEGFGDRDISNFATECAYSQNQDGEIKRVFKTIALIKEIGLNPAAQKELPAGSVSLAVAVHGALKSREGTRADVKQVLQLAAEFGIEWLSEQDLGDALYYYRRPRTREILIDIFKEKRPQFLSWSRFGGALTVGICGFAMSGWENTERALEMRDSQDSHDRTQEIMSEKYQKFGIFGSDKEFAQELAKNPIFAPSSLTLRRTETRTQLNLVDQATHMFGKDSMHSVIKFAQSGMEPEFALAMLRTGNPNGLVRILRVVPSDSRLVAIRVINHQGLQVLQQAAGITHKTGLDPRVFLQPIAAALAVKGKDVIPINPQIFEQPLKPEHERQLRFFYNQPALWQRNIARAVRMYRNAYTITYSHIVGYL
jgi:hypothetical protein